jgi:glycosyltransferase involved in cell wall biosynthesis
MHKRILFLTLRVFSATGGIEKVCRVMGKALYELGLQYGGTSKVFSMYGDKDSADANKYFPQLMFSGFSSNKVKYVLSSIREGGRSEVVIMSHINLLLVGWLVKFFRPKVKLILIAHGIEVWRKLPGWKMRMLRRCDLYLPVSHFTKEKMIELHGLPDEKFSVFNNCLEPFMERPLLPGRREDVMKKYGINKDNRVLLTVSRMSESEQYKGYDKVLMAMPALKKQFPDVKYLLVGKYDINEKRRLDDMVDRLDLNADVIFTGFIPDEEMPDHFNLGDLFLMPSEKEGFGIVFIEAMFYGLPVIAGNKDGSVDALKNGELGTLVNPDITDELVTAIANILVDRERFVPDRKKLFEQFSYEWYKRKVRNCLKSLN